MRLGCRAARDQLDVLADRRPAVAATRYAIIWRDGDSALNISAACPSLAIAFRVDVNRTDDANLATVKHCVSSADVGPKLMSSFSRI